MRRFLVLSLVFSTSTLALFLAGVGAPGCGGDTNSSGSGASLGIDGGPGSNTPLVACSSDTGCAMPTPYCDTAGGHCVQCLSDNNCGAGGRAHCSTTAHQCVACLGDTDCTRAAPYCNTATNTCVVCLSNGNCQMGEACNPTANRCVAACTSDMQCTRAASHCNTAAGYCVECSSNADCAAPTAVCTAASTCVQCTADADCASVNGRPHCDTQLSICLACTTNADCGDGGTCRLGMCR